MVISATRNPSSTEKKTYRPILELCWLSMMKLASNHIHGGSMTGTCGRPVFWRIGKSGPKRVRRTGPPIDRRQRRRLERCQHEGRPSVAVVSVELYSSLIRVQQLIKFFTCLCMFACSTVLSDWLTVITDWLYKDYIFAVVWKISEQTLLSLQRKSKIWDLIWDLSLEDLRFEEKMGLEIWDLVKWFKSVYWMIRGDVGP